MNEIVKEVQKVLPAEMEDVAEQAERPQRIPFRAVENKISHASCSSSPATQVSDRRPKPTVQFPAVILVIFHIWALSVDWICHIYCYCPFYRGVFNFRTWLRTIYKQAPQHRPHIRLAEHKVKIGIAGLTRHTIYLRTPSSSLGPASRTRKTSRRVQDQRRPNGHSASC